MVLGYTAPRQHYPFLPRWPGYPAEGNFIGIIGNWRSRRFGRAVVRGFRKNRDLPAESAAGYGAWLLIPMVIRSDFAPHIKTPLIAMLGATPLLTKLVAIALFGKPVVDLVKRYAVHFWQR